VQIPDGKMPVIAEVAYFELITSGRYRVIAGQTDIFHV
jgi:hypothetical protein